MARVLATDAPMPRSAAGARLSQRASGAEPSTNRSVQVLPTLAGSVVRTEESAACRSLQACAALCSRALAGQPFFIMISFTGIP